MSVSVIWLFKKITTIAHLQLIHLCVFSPLCYLPYRKCSMLTNTRTHTIFKGIVQCDMVSNVNWKSFSELILTHFTFLGFSCALVVKNRQSKRRKFVGCCCRRCLFIFSKRKWDRFKTIFENFNVMPFSSQFLRIVVCLWFLPVLCIRILRTKRSMWKLAFGASLSNRIGKPFLCVLNSKLNTTEIQRRFRRNARKQFGVFFLFRFLVFPFVVFMRNVLSDFWQAFYILYIYLYLASTFLRFVLKNDIVIIVDVVMELCRPKRNR